MVENEYQVLGMSRDDFEERNIQDYTDRACGNIRDPLEMMAHILRGLDIPAEKLRRAAEARIRRVRRGLLGVDKKNLALLENFRRRGIKTALLSNVDIIDILHWKECPLSGCFDAVVFSYDAGLLKPDPRIYHLILEKLDLPPEACLYTGDGGHEELRGARESGLTTVLSTEYIAGLWPEKIRDLKKDADHVINRLEELEELIV